VVHGKESRAFAYGDVISFQQAGAGGYGDPLERDPERVLEDVLDEYVSAEAAREQYGVIFRAPTVDDANRRPDARTRPLVVDHDGTAALRVRMKAGA
jgi:N-methylhydantoinase B